MLLSISMPAWSIFELNFFNNIHPDFLAFGISAIDLAQDVSRGRPYGCSGTATLFRRSLNNYSNRLMTSNSRLTAILLQCEIGPVLIVSVYTTTDYGSADCTVAHGIPWKNTNQKLLAVSPASCSTYYKQSVPNIFPIKWHLEVALVIQNCSIYVFCRQISQTCFVKCFFTKKQHFIL